MRKTRSPTRCNNHKQIPTLLLVVVGRLGIKNKQTVGHKNFGLKALIDEVVSCVRVHWQCSREYLFNAEGSFVSELISGSKTFAKFWLIKDFVYKTLLALFSDDSNQLTTQTKSDSIEWHAQNSTLHHEYSV